MPNLYLSGAGGKARSRLEETGIEIQRSNHLRGLPAQFAMRTGRRQQPLPGIGEEAYTGPGFAVARRGDTVVGVTVRGETVTPDPRAVYWLLATAVGRLDATVSPKLA